MQNQNMISESSCVKWTRHMFVRSCSGHCLYRCVCVGHTSAPPALLGRALVRLQLHELFGHLVVVALREDAEDGETRLVHVDALAEREPDGGAAAGR